MQERIDRRDNAVPSSAPAIASEPASVTSVLPEALSEAPVRSVLGGLLAGPIIPT